LQLKAIKNTRQGNLFEDNETESSDDRELKIGDRVIVKSRKVEAKIIGESTNRGLYEIAYSDSESNTWEGWANLTLIE